MMDRIPDVMGLQGILAHVVRSESRDLFFLSSRRRHTRSLCDWSSDVCSSDLADPGGEMPSFLADLPPRELPANNHLVIYELPTAWGLTSGAGPGERGVGTFRDVLALIDEAAVGANFAGLNTLRAGHSHLSGLGVNALELLPPADSFFKRTWGYDTAHFLAPDYELGFPDGNSSPTANVDLAALVQACHRHRIRFFIDVVMAFARQEGDLSIDFDHH